MIAQCQRLLNPINYVIQITNISEIFHNIYTKTTEKNINEVAFCSKIALKKLGDIFFYTEARMTEETRKKKKKDQLILAC